MRVTGLEPARRKTLDPKSSAATNYATRANPTAKIVKISHARKRHGKTGKILR